MLTCSGVCAAQRLVSTRRCTFYGNAHVVFSPKNKNGILLHRATTRSGSRPRNPTLLLTRSMLHEAVTVTERDVGGGKGLLITQNISKGTVVWWEVRCEPLSRSKEMKREEEKENEKTIPNPKHRSRQPNLRRLTDSSTILLLDSSYRRTKPASQSGSASQDAALTWRTSPRTRGASSNTTCTR